MASVSYGKTIHGLRDIKVTNIGGTTQEDLGAAQEATFTPAYAGGVLVGDDANKEVLTYVIGGQLAVTAGQLSSAVLAIMTGKTLTTAGSSPNETTTLKVSAGDRYPYFKVYAMAYDELAGAAQLLLYKVKIIGGLAIEFRNGQFFTPGFECEVVDDGTNGVFQIKQLETAAAVPAS